MRIAYILPSLIRRGPVIVVHSLVKFLVDQADKIDLYYFDDSSDGLLFSCNTIQISYNHPIDFDSYDIIHAHCFRSDRYVSKWKEYIHKPKIVSTLHQDTNASFSFQYGKFAALFLTKYWCHIQSSFNAVITISNQLNDLYKDKIHTALTTIYNGVDIIVESNLADSEIISKISNLRERYNIVLGTYAYITPRKGLNQVLAALPKLQNTAFVIIGEGPYLNKLKEQVTIRGLSDRVLFLPFLDKPYNYLKDIDIYIMPSLSEGFGLAMVEAAIAKKAIVCSNLPSFHEIFSNNEAGFFDNSNIDSLISAIYRVNRHLLDYQELSYQKAICKFTAETMARNHLLFYQSLIE